MKNLFDNMNPWILLIIAGLLEIGWAITLRYSESFTNIFYSVLNIIFLVVGLYLLAMALEEIPLGTGYATWTAIGTVGVVLVGIMFLGESKSLLRLSFLAIVIIGIIGLEFTTK